MHFIDGGVCAPDGFTANGVLCKFKSSRTTYDLAMIYSEKLCTTAGLFTQNRVKAESVKLTKQHIADGVAQAVIANSGNANCCTGAQGAANALRMAELCAKECGVKTEDVIVCQTGVIGQQMDIKKVEDNVASLKAGLSKEGHEKARQAIMTTDTQYKECAVETEIGGKKVHIGAMCKGSGMIHINLGTMLSFMTTDCAISSQMLAKALKTSVAGTYNCVSIDGDTSTNDSLTILANGMAGNAEIVSEGKDFDAFLEALNAINTQMAKKIAADGEGATKLVEVNVEGVKDVETARGLAKAVICSNLTKAAMFGADANWGSILCAMGYSGFEFTPEKTDVYFESGSPSEKIMVFEQGVPLNFDEDLAKKILSEKEIKINVFCKDGNAKGTAWGCDLTYDYVKINGDYRT